MIRAACAAYSSSWHVLVPRALGIESRVPSVVLNLGACVAYLMVVGKGCVLFVLLWECVKSGNGKSVESTKVSMEGIEPSILSVLSLRPNH
jgi:hypothetical protein